MRLFDIEVDEVSLVDKAANKKKFAFMKRDNTAENKEAEKVEDVKQVEQIIKEQTVVDTDAPTAEELQEIEALQKEITDLAAKLK